MSCVMISPKHCATLAHGLAYLLNQSSGATVPHQLYKAFDGCYSYARYDERRIYAELWRLNAAAYNGRYRATGGEDPEPMPADFPHLLHNLPHQDEHYLLDGDFYAYIKALDCLVYQTAEESTQKTELFNALRLTAQELRNFAVNNTADYCKAAWMF